jgi:hypothetical protein
MGGEGPGEGVLARAGGGGGGGGPPPPTSEGELDRCIMHRVHTNGFIITLIVLL